MGSMGQTRAEPLLQWDVFPPRITAKIQGQMPPTLCSEVQRSGPRHTLPLLSFSGLHS